MSLYKVQTYGPGSAVAGNVDASTGNHLVYFDNIGFSFMEE